MSGDDVRKSVRDRYGKIAKSSGPASCAPSCCGGPSAKPGISHQIGYSKKELSSLPEGANLGLGCGNPVALASLRKGETVLDLGSGAGIDCFLAANKVGKKGKVIGVDMTPEMLEKARKNAEKEKYTNVEFRLGEIENLPVADDFADVIISNCVINLSPDKRRVFDEAFRVLRPGGRLMVSDLVILKNLPDAVKKSIDAYVACIAGAMKKNDYLKAIRSAGFRDVKVVQETTYPLGDAIDDPTGGSLIASMNLSLKDLRDLENAVASIKVHALKPKR